MSRPAWHCRGSRAARDLAAALGMHGRTGAHGGRRAGAGRRARSFLGRRIGEWNRCAIVDAMLHAMSVQPFGREPFAQVPGEQYPSPRLAAMLVAVMLADHSEHRRVVEEIVAGGNRKRLALRHLRRVGRACPRRIGPGATPTWRTCWTYYKHHLAAGGRPDYNDNARLALHRAAP